MRIDISEDGKEIEFTGLNICSNQEESFKVFSTGIDDTIGFGVVLIETLQNVIDRMNDPATEKPVGNLEIKTFGVGSISFNWEYNYPSDPTVTVKSFAMISTKAGQVCFSTDDPDELLDALYELIDDLISWINNITAPDEDEDKEDEEDDEEGNTSTEDNGEPDSTEPGEGDSGDTETPGQSEP